MFLEKIYKLKPKKYSNGLRERVPSTIPSLLILRLKGYSKNNKLFLIYNTSLKKLYPIKANLHSVSNNSEKEKEMEAASLQEGYELLTKQEHILSGIQDQKFS